jgi:hypothetical protein
MIEVTAFDIVKGFFRIGKSGKREYVKPHVRAQHDEHWNKIKQGWDEVRNLRQEGRIEDANTLAQQLKKGYV